jgi:hypothetical protein
MPFVQFSNSKQTTVIASFGGPQDEGAYPNQAEVADDDERYQEFIDPANTVAGQWAVYQASALAALDDTDTTIARIVEAVALGKTSMDAVDVVAFMSYRVALRVILSASMPAKIPAALPTRPAYPVGT